MRAVAIADDRRLVPVERTVEPPSPGQVLLEVAYCGICGSDLHFRDVPELFPAGTIPGHEMSGRVVALGDGVERWSIGDRVSVLPFAQCGECERCLAGEEQVCPVAVARGVGLGTGRPGGYAEQVIVDARMLFALPEAVDDRAGAFSEPLAVGVLTYRRDEFAGAIGLLATGRIPTERLITATLPLEEAEAAFAALSAPGNAHMKVLLSPALSP